MDATYQSEGAWAGFVGSACERVDRNRGGQSNVAPLFELPTGLLAWLGYQEVWEYIGGQTPYAFRQLGLTVHFGHPGEAVKPQAFRSEWAGVRAHQGRGLSFQPPGAGHPHWQMDVLESLRTTSQFPEFVEHPEDQVEEFDAEVQAPDDLLRSVTIERIHFASAAQWWATAAQERPHHMHAPSDEGALTRWALACVAYLKQELARCAVV